MKKIIVTGGSGFIGCNLVNYLINKKYFVINIDKLTYSSNKYFSKIKNKKNYKFFRLDINNKNKLIRIIKKFKPSAIFNLAAETHVDRSIDEPRAFIYTNLNGTFSLLESLRYLQKKKIKPKLIHISTDEVYGDIKGNLRSDENYSYNHHQFKSALELKVPETVSCVTYHQSTFDVPEYNTFFGCFILKLNTFNMETCFNRTFSNINCFDTKLNLQANSGRANERNHVTMWCQIAYTIRQKTFFIKLTADIQGIRIRFIETRRAFRRAWVERPRTT